MKPLFLLFSLFSVLHAAAQKTTYYNWKWEPCDISMARFISVVTQTDSGWLRSNIYIATKKLEMEGLYKDSNCLIANGWQRHYYTNGNLSSEARYTNDVLDGTIINYHYNGMVRDSVAYVVGKPVETLKRWHSNGYIADSVVFGNDDMALQVSWFDNGIPSSSGRSYYWSLYGKSYYWASHGRWRYFHRNGTIASMEEYEKGRLLSRVYFDEEGIELSDTASRDRRALFRGNTVDKWKRYIENNLQWPKGVKLVNTDTVTVVVVATIDEAGNVTDAYVNVPFHPLFDKEVLRVVKRSPKWQPAISHNRYIKDWLVEAVDFIDRRKKD